MKRKGKLLIALGLLLIVAALLLTVYNLQEQLRAEQTSHQAVEQLQQVLPEKTEPEQPDATNEVEIPNYILNPNMDMPTETVNGLEYIGVLRIPGLWLELPVISEWSYPKLKCAPCRYTGSVYLDDMIISAHNYAAHFGKLKTLQPGDEVNFTDMDGNVFVYEVAEVEVLQPTAIEEMQSGDWDLTLFTCTVGGQSRVTVRCKRTAIL